ncbi:MAG: LysE family translocator [Deltaproteobacteria bacterium]|nr:LysE family translocator [Deltaproteobacteria bacterium]
MSVYLVIKGILIGFVVAVPVGPLGILCINRALGTGALCGLLSGLGVATADALAAGIAALGISLVSGILSDYQIPLRVVGGIFLCYLGWQTYWTEPKAQAASGQVSGLLNAYATTFFLTISNPVTILSFIAIYAGLHVPSLHGRYFAATALACGVFVGSASWWVAMFVTMTVCRSKFDLRLVHWVHRISGVLIGGFGIAILLSLTPLKAMIGIEF